MFANPNDQRLQNPSWTGAPPPALASQMPVSQPASVFQAAAWKAGRTYAKAARALTTYDPILLDEMGRVSLLRRTDTKFVLRAGDLVKALWGLSDSYRVLDIDGRRLHDYRTLYFDTPDLLAYRQHHAGMRHRYKVRSRQYVDTGLAFLEVKRKTNQNRTVKKRMRTTGWVTELDRQDRNFVREHYPNAVDELHPGIWNSFYRITLVSLRRVERLTLDIDLQFGNRSKVGGIPEIAIAEVKQDGFSMQSDFIEQMRRLGVRSVSFSKYCIGAAQVYPDLKRNRFKDRMLLVEKLRGCGNTP